MKLTIPFRTPSVNALYGTTFRHGGMYLKKEAKDLKKEILNLISVSTPNEFSNGTNKELKITVKIFEDWYTKKGDIKKKDISNREKFLIDSVFEGLGIDDKQIFEHNMIKVQSKDEKAEIILEAFK